MHVPDLAVLDQRSGDRDPVVAGLLGERDHGGQTAGLGGEPAQTRVVEPHRDLCREVLEHIARKAELREDDQAGTLRAGLTEEVDVLGEILVQRAEPRRELCEGDPKWVHALLARRCVTGASLARDRAGSGGAETPVLGFRAPKPCRRPRARSETACAKEGTPVRRRRQRVAEETAAAHLPGREAPPVQSSPIAAYPVGDGHLRRITEHVATTETVGAACGADGRLDRACRV